MPSYQVRLRRVTGETSTISAPGDSERASAIAVLRRRGHEGDIVEVITYDDSGNALGTCDVTVRGYVAPSAAAPVPPAPRAARAGGYSHQRHVDAARALLRGETPAVPLMDSPVEEPASPTPPAKAEKSAPLLPTLRLPGVAPIPSVTAVDSGVIEHVDLTDAGAPVEETAADEAAAAHGVDLFFSGDMRPARKPKSSIPAFTSLLGR